MSGKLKFDEINALLAQASQKVAIGSEYVHYKNPEQSYKIIDLVMIEANQKIGVVYQAMYPELQGIKFVRPLDEFLEEIDQDGKIVTRFKKI